MVPNLPAVKVDVEHVLLWFQTSKVARSTTTPSMLVLHLLLQEPLYETFVLLQAPRVGLVKVYNVEKVNNCAVTTVEGIGAKKGDLQAIQNEMINTDGSQCGFCTPGMIMTMYTVIRNYKKVTNKQLHQALQGNLCRCTGYRPIWQAFKNTKE